MDKEDQIMDNKDNHALIAQHQSGSLPREDAGEAPAGRTKRCASVAFLCAKETASQVLKAGEDNTVRWIPIDNSEKPLCIVFGWRNGALYGKIARNTSALQCDYDLDWEMPEIDGEIFDTEAEINDENIDEVIEWWLNEALNAEMEANYGLY